jgi:putative hydrolase of the HAD superfamily
VARPVDIPLRAVTFDFWNTLIRETGEIRRRRLDAWLGLLEGEGAAVERESLNAAFDMSWGRFQDAWRANLRYDAFDAVRDVLEHTGLKPPGEVIDGLVSIVTDPDTEWHPETTPNVEKALARLAEADIRIGIICDVGLTPSRTLRRFLAEHELLHYFDHWSFSDEVGMFKPHELIFRHALAGLGDVDPSEAAHIGDLRRTDVAGAQALGMFAVRYTGVNDDPGSPDDGTDEVEGDAVVADHDDLSSALGLE